MIPFSARRLISNNNNNAPAPADTINLTDNNNNLNKQEEFVHTSSRITDKMTTFFEKFKNNSNSLDDMINNMKRFENMLDSSISPNSFNNRQQ